MAILPPGVSAESFQSAIREHFQDAIGRDWVFTSDDDLYSYRDHFSYIEDQPNELIPSAAVGPDKHRPGAGDRPDRGARTSSDVPGLHGPQPQLRRPRAQRARSASRPQADEQDPQGRRHPQLRLVEPGVTYFDLFNHVQENKLNGGWTCPTRAGAAPSETRSITASATSAAYRDHFGAR